MEQVTFESKVNQYVKIGQGHQDSTIEQTAIRGTRTLTETQLRRLNHGQFRER